MFGYIFPDHTQAGDIKKPGIFNDRLFGFLRLHLNNR